MPLLCPTCGQVFGKTYHLAQHQQDCAAPVKPRQESKPSAWSDILCCAPNTDEIKPFVFSFKKDFENENSGSIDQRHWRQDDFVGAHHIAGGLGSTGVYLLKLAKKKGVVVLKQGGPSTPLDFFCSQLYILFGIKAPAMRVLSKDEFARIADTIQNTPSTEEGDLIALSQPRARQTGGILMEYIPGYSLSHPNAAACLGSSNVLQKLGGMIAVDMLVNNFDRTPFIWSHLGNANNILFSETKGCEVELCAIDQSCTAITNVDGFKAYMSHVEKAILEASNKNLNGFYISKVQKFLSAFGGVVDEQGCSLIQQGLLSMLSQITRWDPENSASIWTETMSHFSGWCVHIPGQAEVIAKFITEVHRGMCHALQAPADTTDPQSLAL